MVAFVKIALCTLCALVAFAPSLKAAEEDNQWIIDEVSDPLALCLTL
jgi:hypothetical protein